MRCKKIQSARMICLLFSILLTACVPGAFSQSAASSNSCAMPITTTDDRNVSLKQLPGNILADQKDIWLFPLKLAHGKHWWPAIGIVGVTSALVATDAHTAPPFRTTNDFSGFNEAFSGSNTAAIILAVPAAIYGLGWLHKDNYDKDSGLLAGEAVADGFLLNIPFKAITARRQPLSYYGNGPYADSFFNGSHNPFHVVAAAIPNNCGLVRWQDRVAGNHEAYGSAPKYIAWKVVTFGDAGKTDRSCRIPFWYRHLTTD